MNQNIEVINKKLIAVRFSLLPLIKEIDYEPDNEVPAYEEFGRVTNEGVLILNKDYPGYRIMKEWMTQIMKKKNKVLKREIETIEKMKHKTDKQVAYAAMLKVETERREKEGVKPIWQR